MFLAVVGKCSERQKEMVGISHRHFCCKSCALLIQMHPVCSPHTVLGGSHRRRLLVPEVDARLPCDFSLLAVGQSRH